MAQVPSTSRTQLYRDPGGLMLHELVLESCRRFAEKIAIVDYSCDPPRRISYGEFGDLIERVASGLSARLAAGEVLGIYLSNCWEFCIAFHAAGLAGLIPTLLNPSYRDREVHYQLENSGAVALLTDRAQIQDINLKGLSQLREVFTTRTPSADATPFASLLHRRAIPSPRAAAEATEIVAALPYSSGTTGLPKGVMLSHSNLVTNIFQFLAPGEESTYRSDDIALCCLPLYHIYGLNVVLNSILSVGGTLVLMPRFEEARFLRALSEEHPTFLPLVPPLVNCLTQAAEQAKFPREHRVRYAKSGAAPLAPELARRFTDLTGIRLRQGYGMTEASPVTHLGFIEKQRYCPETIGQAVAQTECRLEGGVDPSQGELVMRGPQFMLGYWNALDATRAALRDGWYWSGDVATVDDQGFYRVVDRLKEMIKYKGFPIAPAEVESVLLEHPLVGDCAIVGQKDDDAGEIPCAFVVLRNGDPGNSRIADELCGFVADRLTSYKQPRKVRFVHSIPRNPSGKILRRMLRDQI